MIRMLIVALVLLTAAQPDAPAVTGDVRAPDGSAVTQGTVALLASSPSQPVTSPIDRTGHFRIAVESPGLRTLFISAPGYAPHRVNVTVPQSGHMALPPVTLLGATYFRARFVSADGDVLGPAGLRRRSMDSDGIAIPDPLGHVRVSTDQDGSVRIGPLPPGRTLMAFDQPPLAQTRLPDITVGGTRTVIEGGTIVIAAPSVMEVEIVDAAGRPVPDHDVSIEDAAQPSPLGFPAVRTNESGVAGFDRLSARRYRVWTQTAERCRSTFLSIARPVSAGASRSRARIQIGGRAVMRVTSVLNPLIGRPVAAWPDTPAQTPWRPNFAAMALRRAPVPQFAPASCGGTTDGDGRVTLAPFPPGAAQVRVQLFNSFYIARVTVPNDDREIAVAVPDGLIPVRVTDRGNGRPLGSARVTWLGDGSRVEAGATANGDVLLEAAGRSGGTLTVSAQGYQTLEGAFAETPETLQEVSLARLPDTGIDIHVVTSEGQPVAGAIVELAARRPDETAEFVATNAKGVATFSGLPAGTLQLNVFAGGFADARVQVTEDARRSTAITLTRR